MQVAQGTRETRQKKTSYMSNLKVEKLFDFKFVHVYGVHYCIMHLPNTLRPERPSRWHTSFRLTHQPIETRLSSACLYVRADQNKSNKNEID